MGKNVSFQYHFRGRKPRQSHGLLERAITGQFLLIGCSDCKGMLAIDKTYCQSYYAYRPHIMVKTDGFQHPHCISMTIGDSSTSPEYSNVTTDSLQNYYSKAYRIESQGEQDFNIRASWNSGHSPYPEINAMEFWIFGQHFSSRYIPKRPDEPLYLATIHVTNEGQVTVNGTDCGIWPELVYFNLLEEFSTFDNTLVDTN